MHAQSAQRCLVPVQTGDLMLTHLWASNCCHGCLPAVLTPTALCNFPPLAALGMLSLLENGRHRHPITAEHWKHLCSIPAAEETAALGACLPGMGDSSRNTKVSHLAVLNSTAIAAASLVPHQLASARCTCSTGGSFASSRVSWGYAWAWERKNLDGTSSIPHIPPAEANKHLLQFTTVSPKHN